MTWLDKYRALPRQFTLMERLDKHKLEMVIQHPYVSPEDLPKYKELLTKVSESPDGLIPVTYVRGEYGRYHPTSYCSTAMWSSARADVTPDNIIDIDAKSAFANIVSYLCTEHNIAPKAYDHILAYAQNKKPYIDTLNITESDVEAYNELNCSMLTRAEIGKQVFNMFCFGAGEAGFKKIGLKNPFPSTGKAKLFKKQWNTIKEVLATAGEYTDIINYVKNKKNDSYHNGCAMSTICQSVEALATYSLMELFKNNGFTIRSYEYDGFTVENKKEEVEEMMTCFKTIIPYIVKERPTPLSSLVFTYDPPTAKSKIPKVDVTSYEYMKEEFEKTHFLIVQPGVYIDISNGVHRVKTHKDLLASYRHMTYTYDVTKKGSFISRWTTDPEIRRYEDMDVYPPPLEVPEGHYNLWKAFPGSSGDYVRDEDGISKFDFHINMLCGYNEETTKYIKAWFGHMLKYPAEKCGTMPILIAKQGSGRGWLMDLISKIIGEERYVTTSEPSKDVWGAFNGLMANAYFVVLDEISREETKFADGKLRKLITDPKININEKGLKQRQVRSYHRWFATLNPEDGEPFTTHDGDRRNIYIRCSDDYSKGNKTDVRYERNIEYHNALYSKLKSPDFIRTIHDHLITFADEFASLRPPETSFHKTLKESNKPLLEQWLIDVACKTTLPLEIKMTKEEILEQFNIWCSSVGIKQNRSALSLAQDLSKKGYPYTKSKYDKNYIFNRERLLDHFGMMDFNKDYTT